jgi:integrase
MLRILESMRALASEYVFEGQKRHRPLSNMSMLMLMRRMGRGQYTVHGLSSSFRDWVGESAGVAREVAEAALAHQIGSDVERAYARSDLLDRRRTLMAAWSRQVEISIA